MMAERETPPTGKEVRDHRLLEKGAMTKKMEQRI